MAATVAMSCMWSKVFCPGSLLGFLERALRLLRFQTSKEWDVSPAIVHGELDEVVVGIAEVHAGRNTTRAGARPGAGLGTMPFFFNSARISSTVPSHSRQKSAPPGVGCRAPR